jgi:hypothetical protein
LGGISKKLKIWREKWNKSIWEVLFRKVYWLKIDLYIHM